MKQIYLSILFVLLVSLSSLSTFAQTKSREDLHKELEAKRLELDTLEKNFLSASDEDRSTYADFLRQPNTGLVRLMPREVFDNEIRKGIKLLTIRGGGAYYSFSRLTHDYGYGSDISLEQNYLSVGFAGADYGMLLKLSEVSLEQLDSEHPAARFLAGYTPPTLEPEIRKEQRRFIDGTEINSVVYKERLPLEVGATYLVRSITFDRADVLVGFKVLRQDTDGSIVLLWKLLRKYQTPLIARNG
jgi:hypothetical protein